MSFTETSPPGSSQHDPKPGVVSADSQPWISYSEPKTADAEPASKAPAKTSVLPFAIGGAPIDTPELQGDPATVGTLRVPGTGGVQGAMAAGGLRRYARTGSSMCLR